MSMLLSMRVPRGFALLALALSSSHAFAAEPTLCKADELVVFSCSTGARIASVCASKDISKTGGFLQYRFGRTDGVELAFPDPGAKPADVFTSGTLMFSGGGGAWLRFGKAPFSYTVFTAIGKWGRAGSPADVAGVAVAKDGKEFANFPCRKASAAASELGPDFFEKLDLKASDSADDFEIPDAFFPKN
jgi:hypothetical protein